MKKRRRFPGPNQSKLTASEHRPRRRAIHRIPIFAVAGVIHAVGSEPSVPWNPLSKRELEAVFTAGRPPEVSALAGFEFRGYNQPRAATAADSCNTSVAQNGLAGEWLSRRAMASRRGMRTCGSNRPTLDAADQLQRGAMLLDGAALVRVCAGCLDEGGRYRSCSWLSV